MSAGLRRIIYAKRTAVKLQQLKTFHLCLLQATRLGRG